MDSIRSDATSDRGADGLTSREGAVMRCLAKGLLYKEAAYELGVSYSAIHKHQHKIFRKLRAGNRTEAILLWHDLLRRQPRAEVAVPIRAQRD